MNAEAGEGAAAAAQAAGAAQAATAAQAVQTADAQEAELRFGLLSALAAFGLWGVAPLYWKLLDHIPAFETIAHRIVWGAVTFGAILLYQKRLRSAVLLLRNPRLRAALLVTTLLIGANWLIYIWAVVYDHVLDASLGYFINPLFSVALGALVLRERLNRIQMISVGLAALGVVILTAGLDGIPWISLTLAVTFAAYGLIRKMIPVSSVDGLFIETALCAPFCAAYLLWLSHTGAAAAVDADWRTWALLLIAGPFTAAPLFFFNLAARRVRLSTLGLVQYMSPSLQFLLAVALFGEPFTTVHAVVFGLIWIGCALFSWDSHRRYRQGRVH